MPSNNSKYTEEFREQTVRHILETGKSATSMGRRYYIYQNKSGVGIPGSGNRSVQSRNHRI